MAVPVAFPQALPDSTNKAAPSKPPANTNVCPVMSQQAKDVAHQAFAKADAGQADDLWAMFAESMKQALGGQQKFSDMMAQGHAQVGTETKMLEESLVPFLIGPATVYSRLSQFSSAPMPIMTVIAVDTSGQLVGFYMRPEENPAESRFLDYKDKTKLKLPVSGDWFVYQGGRSTFENYHAAANVNRFALDLVVLKDGHPYSGDGSSNEQFYSFGKPVLAAAAGTVVEVENSLADNPPGKPGQEEVTGNHVTVDHGNGEFSLVAHLKQGSVKVKVGDKVKQGQEIGACGNSGNSPAPHLHFQLQTTKEFKGTEGLPAQFVNYVADDKPVAMGEPVRGQTIKNQ